jgi:hypothetical protein
MQWKYKVLVTATPPSLLDGDRPGMAEGELNRLNKLGADDWELVAAVASQPPSRYFLLIFKKPQP